MTPAEAARLIVNHVQPLPAERRPLRDALDAVLAEDVASPIDLPPWDNSAMDGYAVRSADLQEPATELDVIETVPAGQFPAKSVGGGQATRIFTGAPLPEGAGRDLTVVFTPLHGVSGALVQRVFAEAGYDHVYLHQVGPDQEGFLGFAERELLPRYAS